MGVPAIVVFLNKCDQVDDEELLELVTRIVHERRPDVSCVVTFDSGFSSPDRPAEQL